MELDDDLLNLWLRAITMNETEIRDVIGFVQAARNELHECEKREAAAEDRIDEFNDDISKLKNNISKLRSKIQELEK